MKYLVVGTRERADEWAETNGVERRHVIAATEPKRVNRLHEDVTVIPNPMWLMKVRGTREAMDALEAIQRARFLQKAYGGL